MARRLKVFRTSIGFHDAYVAAPSRAAALRAWGASRDLFATGAAEEVTDPALTDEPLARAGEVVTRSRGGLREQLAALGPAESPAPPPGRKAPRPAPTPRPSRKALEQAEQAIAHYQAQAAAELDDLRAREVALAHERDAVVARQREALAKLEQRRARAAERLRTSMAAWARRNNS